MHDVYCGLTTNLSHHVCSKIKDEAPGYGVMDKAPGDIEEATEKNKVSGKTWCRVSCLYLVLHSQTAFSLGREKRVLHYEFCSPHHCSQGNC